MFMFSYETFKRNMMSDVIRTLIKIEPSMLNLYSYFSVSYSYFVFLIMLSFITGQVVKLVSKHSL